MADLEIDGVGYLLTEHPSDGYEQAPTEMEFTDALGIRFAGRAERTGVTPPGFPDRAVYQIVLSSARPQPGYYVYDGGHLHPSDGWRDSHRQGERRQP